MSGIFNTLKNLASTSRSNAGGEANVKFSVGPLDGDGDFEQWLHAMRLVARLPSGVPNHFRKKLWLTLAERHLTERGVDWPKAERNCFRVTQNADDTELGSQIVKDLHRTGCSLFCGSEGRENQAMLRRVLLAYARWNKTVGYCQGFNMIAAIILEVMDKSEVDALKVMIFLVEAVLPEGYFSEGLRGLSADMAAFRDLLRIRLPKLARHMDKLQKASDGGGIEPPLPDVFTMQWFLTLYATWLPRPALLRVWDLTFLDGNEILLLTALAIWEHLQDRILAARSADEYYSCMGAGGSGGGASVVWDSGDIIASRVAVLRPEPELPKLRDQHRLSLAPLQTAVQSVTKKGLSLFYSEDEGDSSDDNNKMAIIPSTGSRYDSSLAGSERLSLDIGALKRQYARLRERQRQAHIILAAACARHAAMGGPTTPTSLAVDQLLLGKRAIISSKGRRLGPPAGSIPPRRHSTQPTTNKEEISWNDEKRRRSLGRRDSIKWRDIKGDCRKASLESDDEESGHGEIVSQSEADEIAARVRSRRKSSGSSSYSDQASSSSDTSLCDNQISEGDSEPSSLQEDLNHEVGPCLNDKIETQKSVLDNQTDSVLRDYDRETDSSDILSFQLITFSENKESKEKETLKLSSALKRNDSVQNITRQFSSEAVARCIPSVQSDFNACLEKNQQDEFNIHKEEEITKTTHSYESSLLGISSCDMEIDQKYEYQDDTLQKSVEKISSDLESITTPFQGEDKSNEYNKCEQAIQLQNVDPIKDKKFFVLGDSITSSQDATSIFQIGFQQSFDMDNKTNVSTPILSTPIKSPNKNETFVDIKDFITSPEYDKEFSEELHIPKQKVRTERGYGNNEHIFLLGNQLDNKYIHTKPMTKDYTYPKEHFALLTKSPVTEKNQYNTSVDDETKCLPYKIDYPNVCQSFSSAPLNSSIKECNTLCQKTVDIDDSDYDKNNIVCSPETENISRDFDSQQIMIQHLYQISKNSCQNIPSTSYDDTNIEKTKYSFVPFEYSDIILQLREDCSSKEGFKSRPPDIIDDLVRYPNFMTDISISDLNDLDETPKSPGCLSIAISEDEAPIPLEIDKYFEDSPDFFGVRKIATDDSCDERILNRRKTRRQVPFKKPDVIYNHSSSSDKSSSPDCTKNKANNKNDSLDYFDMKKVQCSSIASDPVNSLEGTPMEHQSSIESVETSLRSGRKNSEKALEIIQENSKILSRILTKKNNTSVDLFSKTKQTSYELNDEAFAVNSTLKTKDENDQNMNQEYTWSTEKTLTRENTSQMPNPSSEINIVSKTCEQKEMRYDYERQGDSQLFSFNNPLDQSIRERSLSPHNLSDHQEALFNKNDYQFDFDSSLKRSDHLCPRSKDDSSEIFDYSVSSKYSDKLFSKASDICSKYLDNPQRLHDFSRKDDSQGSDFAYIVTSSISFSYEKSAADKLSVDLKSDSSDTLCQVASLDQISTPVSPKVFQRESSMHESRGDGTYSAVTPLVDNDTLSSLSFPKSASSCSVHHLPGRNIKSTKDSNFSFEKLSKQSLQSP